MTRSERAILGFLLGFLLAVALITGKPRKMFGVTGGGGEPCYPPTNMQSDGSCR